LFIYDGYKPSYEVVEAILPETSNELNANKESNLNMTAVTILFNLNII